MPEESLNDTPQQRARKAFIDLVTREEDAAIDLAQAALLIALEEYPDLDIASCMAQLDLLAQRVRSKLGLSGPDQLPQLPTKLDLLTVIDAMNLVLFEEEHFTGNQADYYSPSNSFLNKVLEKRKGISITLSLVYMEVGKRVGLQIEGIGLPFHFIVRCRLPGGDTYIDPFEHGRSLSEEECRERIYRVFKHNLSNSDFDPHWFEPVSHKQLLIRMLTNLKHIYTHREDYIRALSICDRILVLAPGMLSERRDRGIVHFHLKHYARAIQDLAAYVEQAPAGEDTSDIQRQIKAIRQMIAMLN
ncbi:MAG TPA: transglutaminase-like domain-containing protein [Ktedonobacteraceae bacterium]|nr:transglutaminase-like domain-containing protein [Ktedonobacteraceae bacterium]